MMSMTAWVIIAVVLMVVFLVYDHFKTKNIEQEDVPAKAETPVPTPLTESEILAETEVRKRWLISFVLYMTWGVILSFFTFLTIFMATAAEKGDISLPVSILIAIIGIAMISIPAIWITYHCAYTKRGTAWLTFLLIIIPFRYVQAASSDMFEFESSIDAASVIVVAVIDIVIAVFYWWNCFCLRKVNALRKSKMAG
jgi:multisubunit Na+/H+ antiporter MnhB subunit